MTTQIVRLKKPSGICTTTNSVILNHETVAIQEDINLTKIKNIQNIKPKTMCPSISHLCAAY